MIKKIAVAATKILITASPLAYAAESASNSAGMAHPSAADLKALTDARVAMIKAALQLTPESAPKIIMAMLPERAHTCLG
jgi:hypothetical protein